MKRSLIIPIASLFIALLSTGMRCNKEEVSYQYNFVEKVRIFPTQKTYKQGDTIWLQYTNPNKQLQDERTNQSIAVNGVWLGFQVAFNSRYNTPINPAGGFCDFVTVYGVNAGRYLGEFGTTLSTTFGCNTSNSLDFMVGVVPKQKGIYSLDFLGAPGTVSDCPNQTTSFPLSTIAYRFDVADGNKDVYQTIPIHARSEPSPGYTESKIDAKQVYVVKVE